MTKNKKAKTKKKPYKRDKIETSDKAVEIGYESIRGKPTTFDYAYCDQLIAHMAKGHSFSSFGAVINVSRTSLFTWAKQNEDFAVAKKIGEDNRLLMLERIGLKVAAKGGGSAAAWIFTMKNTQGWTDKIEVTEKDPDEGDSSAREKRIKRIEELEKKRRAILKAKK